MPEQSWFDKFFDDLYGQVLGGQFEPASTMRQARLVKRLLRLRRGQCVLDCPCGFGRVTIPLARLGLTVTGADFQPSYLARARRRARKEGLAVEFVGSDMRALPFRNRFDAVVNWFGSFGYFDDAGNLATARAALAALRPGGRFLIDGINKSWLVPHFRPHGEKTINSVRIIHNVRWQSRTNRTVGTWTFCHGGRRRRRPISIRIYNGAELRALLTHAGFARVELFGYTSPSQPVPWPLGQLTRHSRRFIAVAQKGDRG